MTTEKLPKDRLLAERLVDPVTGCWILLVLNALCASMAGVPSSACRWSAGAREPLDGPPSGGTAVPYTPETFQRQKGGLSSDQLPISRAAIRSRAGLNLFLRLPPTSTRKPLQPRCGTFRSHYPPSRPR
jgi:hypothetical protein